MKKYLVILILLIGAFAKTLDAQELVPRFYWAEMYDTLDVKKTSMEELRQALDSIDFTTVSEKELAYLERYLEPFQKRWMAEYGHVPKKIDQSTTIFVGGMECDKCEEVVKQEIESVEGVTGVMEISREDNTAVFSFVGVSQEMIEKVISTLENNLIGCGYFFYENHMRESDEVKKDLENLAILKEAIGSKECDKH